MGVRLTDGLDTTAVNRGYTMLLVIDMKSINQNEYKHNSGYNI
jgi:hypothetical protein